MDTMSSSDSLAQKYNVSLFHFQSYFLADFYNTFNKLQHKILILVQNLFKVCRHGTYLNNLMN